MIDGLNQFFSDLSNLLWGWPMIILLLGTHIYLTIILRFPQRHIFKAIRLSIKRDHEATGDVSQFASLATALAATIGTPTRRGSTCKARKMGDVESSSSSLPAVTESFVVSATSTKPSDQFTSSFLISFSSSQKFKIKSFQ